ncbi:MAG TPA: hemolysin family protein [Verrucomicrobiota bacterium]|nr:hemolysin family protein [Verrucomicrobiota bacterium]HNU50092.1 hemolysin family protein [Verrucomicrobiota bacterium]
MPALVILAFVAAGASFFFALAETALFSLGHWQVRRLAEADRGGGGMVARLLGEPEDLLATIVLGNTVANGGLVCTGVWLVLEEGWLALPTLAGVLLLILAGGEVVPKTLAVRAPEFWALRVAGPMAALQAGTRPIRRLAQAVNGWLLKVLAPSVRPMTGTPTDDYTELLEMGCQQGALAESEKEILLQILSLGRRTAKDVMIPRAQMRALPDDLPVSEMAAMARRYRHARLPLYDGSPDTIVGVLNTRQLLLDPEGDLAEAIEFPSFVSETANLWQLLRSLQRQRRGLAIVLDEYGTTAGLVTTEDILGAVIGRIRGEGEAEGFVMERLGPGRWRVNGTMRLEDFRREYPGLEDMPEVETLGGLMVALAEVVPPVGHSVRYSGLRLTATVADDRRVREIEVEVVRRGEGGGGRG